MRAKRLAIECDNARAFLPAMLQRVQPEVSQLRRFRVIKNPENAAVMFWVSRIGHRNCGKRLGWSFGRRYGSGTRILLNLASGALVLRAGKVTFASFEVKRANCPNETNESANCFAKRLSTLAELQHDL